MADIQDLNVVDDNNQQYWPENTMKVKDVNNAGRGDEGIMARWFADINGTVVSVGMARRLDSVVPLRKGLCATT